MGQLFHYFAISLFNLDLKNLRKELRTRNLELTHPLTKLKSLDKRSKTSYIIVIINNKSRRGYEIFIKT